MLRQNLIQQVWLAVVNTAKRSFCGTRHLTKVVTKQVFSTVLNRMHMHTVIKTDLSGCRQFGWKILQTEKLEAEAGHMVKHPLRIQTSFASITVPTPTVSAMVGTLDKSPSKNLAFAMMVSFAKVFTLVLETKLEPGSLKAMWPSGPIPYSTGTIHRKFISSCLPQEGLDQL